MTGHIVKRQKPHILFVYWTLLFWLLASLSSAHGHFCFDGQEPPVSVHMEFLGDHVKHHDVDEKHVDMDVDLSPTLMAKLLKIDLPLLILLTTLFIVLVFLHQPLLLNRTPILLFRFIGIRPPLRAPPKFSA